MTRTVTRQTQGFDCAELLLCNVTSKLLKVVYMEKPEVVDGKVEYGCLAVDLAASGEKGERFGFLVNVLPGVDGDSAGFLKSELVDAVSKLWR
jgi:hypothetical protein